MNKSIRQSMAWLHTWAGVTLGSLALAIFWMGCLSVFDREIDRWMQPGTRLASPAKATTPLSLDKSVLPIATHLTAGSAQWSLILPTERAPHVRLSYRTQTGATEHRAIDPHTAQLIADQGSFGGTGFFFAFHYMLNLKWQGLGYWLVGITGMAMLVLMVSGVLVHRKLLADFFLFRPHKHLARASLDLHNLTGVLPLPFHFMMTLSGLVIFMSIYFPFAHVGAYGHTPESRAAYQAEAMGRYARPMSGQPATLGSLDAMLAQAEQHWSGGQAYYLRIWHPGDANSYVEVRRSHARDVTMNLDQIYFDAATGQVLSRFEAQPVMNVQRFLTGMHFMQFDHWGLRWLYFLAGLAGCVMIATGLLFWLEARRASHARKGLAGVRMVEAITIGSVSGMLIATLAFLVANRLLPQGLSVAGQERAELEAWAFYLAWLGSFVHAACLPTPHGAQFARQAWQQQCLCIAALAILAVVLNGLTTPEPLPLALSQGKWAVAGVDLALLTTALMAAMAARRLRQASPRHAPSAPTQAASLAANTARAEPPHA